MATRVRFAIPEREIENTGITFSRVTDSGGFGKLTIRQNHLVWRRNGFEYVYTVSWDAFAKFAEDNGKREKPKTTAVRAKKKLVKAASA